MPSNTKMIEDNNINSKGADSKMKRRKFFNTIQEIYKEPTSVLESTFFVYGTIKYAAVFANITNKLGKYVAVSFNYMVTNTYKVIKYIK